MYSLIHFIFSFCLFGFIDVSFFMSSFPLWQMSSESKVFIGFADGAIWQTWRLASVAWVIFTPQGQLLSSRGIGLGDATNYVGEYNAVLDFLHDALLQGISYLWVYLYAQLVVSQLNGVYRVHDPTLHQRFLRVHLLE
jgi:ribonuclease HI